MIMTNAMQSTGARQQWPLPRLASERGSQLLEFALILPFLLVIIGGISDFGLLFRTQSVVVNAAREGARLAVLPGNEQDNYATVRARINEYLADGRAPGTATITIVPNSVQIAPGTLAGGVLVTITYTHDTLFLRPAISLIDGNFADLITFQTSAFMRTHIAAVGP